MIARWDALLLAALLSGGSMLIENSHRIDTGVADDVPALSAGACTTGPAAEPADVGGGDRSFSLTAIGDDAVPACE